MSDLKMMFGGLVLALAFVVAPQFSGSASAEEKAEGATVTCCCGDECKCEECNCSTDCAGDGTCCSNCDEKCKPGKEKAGAEAKAGKCELCTSKKQDKS